MRTYYFLVSNSGISIWKFNKSHAAFSLEQAWNKVNRLCCQTFLQPHFSIFLNYLFENEGSVFWNNYAHSQHSHTHASRDWRIITSEICIIILNFMQPHSKYASFSKLITVLIFIKLVWISKREALCLLGGINLWRSMISL